ncbi:MAG TPA: lysophospholipid acyltransferase family protein [Pseudolabrys sp.]|nr:lysophospholipid acyltransferase family protein [Pseudolabrys sp.]
MIRALFIAAFFFTMTPLLISVQWLLGKLRLPGWGFIACNYYRVLCKLLGIKVRLDGAPTRERAVLYVCNHVSWADILVIGAVTPVAFVAKKEVRAWPLVGITAELQRTVFVDRERRQQAADAVGEIVKRLEAGTSVVLFAEGTSSDGNRVLPFRSALLGAVKQVAARGPAGDNILVQPMSISYTGVHGIAMGRRHRPLAAWYGDLDFMPHIKAFIARGAVDAVVSYAEPVGLDGAMDRKALTRRLESAVRRLMTDALLERPQLTPAASKETVMPLPASAAAS